MTKRGYFILLTILAAICTVVYVVHLFQPPSALEFWLHRKRYEAIVAFIKARGSNLDADKHYYVDPDLDPETLRRAGRYDPRFVRVSLSRIKGNRYEVTITTTDEGHLGYLGYIYSDGP